jgi:hypothetical protein
MSVIELGKKRGDGNLKTNVIEATVAEIHPLNSAKTRRTPKF